MERPRLNAPVVEMKENVIRGTDHRTGFWSAGIIHQFNGARTPPIPKKMSKKENPTPMPQA